MIVNDVEFIESGSGDAKRAVGQFVGVNQRGMKSSFAGFHPGIQQDCMEHSIEKGRKLIYQFAQVLGIHGHCAELAHGFYKMLLERKFLRGGRRNALVAAACLYLACRNEQLPLLLLDFSDQLEETVTNLSQMYIRIARELCINPPSADPCIYVERFCEKLDFGQETKDVSMTSMRILSRMKRDWIAAGRRPFGLCGASIFLGAKLHGFDRSLVDIVKVVGAQVSTMTKRLREFTRTASSKLTIEEFYLVDLEEEHDPPSFHEMKKKRGINFPEFNEEEFQRLDSEIERNIQLDKQKRRNGKSSTESENDNSVASNGLYGLSESVVGTAMDLSQYMGLPKDALASIDGAIDGVTDVIKEALQTRIEAENSVDNAGYMPVTCESLGIDPLNPERAESKVEINGSSSSVGLNGISAEDKDVSEIGSVASGDAPVVVEELFIDDLDDKEMDSYILTPEESQRKAILWTATYGRYMEMRAAKLKLKEEEKQRNADGNKKKRASKPKSEEGYVRPTKKLKTDRPAATANEAIDNIIKQKNISEKINVAVLQNLRIEKPLGASSGNSPTRSDFSKQSGSSVVNQSTSDCGSTSSSASASSQLSSANLTSRLASAFRKSGPSRPAGASKASPNISKSPSKSAVPKAPKLKEFNLFAKK